MMLRHMGWVEAADAIIHAVERAIQTDRQPTTSRARWREQRQVSTSASARRCRAHVNADRLALLLGRAQHGRRRPAGSVSADLEYSAGEESSDPLVTERGGCFGLGWEYLREQGPSAGSSPTAAVPARRGEVRRARCCSIRASRERGTGIPGS